MKYEPGALFSIQIGPSKAYVQYVQPGPSTHDIVRLMPGLYENEPELAALLASRELRWLIFGIRSLARTGHVAYVGKYPLPADIPPMFVQGPTGNENEYVVNMVADATTGLPNKIRTLLPEQVANLPSFGLPNLAYLKAILPEWNGLLEHKKIEQTPSFNQVRHFLYFESARAAKKIRTAILNAHQNVTVQIQAPNADIKAWSLHVDDVATPPDPYRLSDSLTRLCEQLDGEYDGFEAPLPA